MADKPKDDTAKAEVEEDAPEATVETEEVETFQVPDDLSEIADIDALVELSNLVKGRGAELTAAGFANDDDLAEAEALAAADDRITAELATRHEAMAAGAFLHEYYRSAEGLQRPEGLWIGGHPDWEGIGAWLFDVWLQARINGTADAEARQAFVRQIRAADEWRLKHPGERP